MLIPATGSGGHDGYYSAYTFSYDQVSFSNIERFEITGTVANDLISTGDGNDIIDGGEGDDTINSGAGDDTINSGAGIDTLVDADFSSATTDINLDDTDNGKTITVPDGTTVTNIERFTNLTTGSGNDVISFTQRINNNINTGGGDDTINSGLGIDSVDGG